MYHQDLVYQCQVDKLDTSRHGMIDNKLKNIYLFNLKNYDTSNTSRFSKLYY